MPPTVIPCVRNVLRGGDRCAAVASPLPNTGREERTHVPEERACPANSGLEERTHVLEERACPANNGREERTHVLEERACPANTGWEERTNVLEERFCPANNRWEERTRVLEECACPANDGREEHPCAGGARLLCKQWAGGAHPVRACRVLKRGRGRCAAVASPFPCMSRSIVLSTYDQTGRGADFSSSAAPISAKSPSCLLFSCSHTLRM